MKKNRKYTIFAGLIWSLLSLPFSVFSAKTESDFAKKVATIAIDGTTIGGVDI